MLRTSLTAITARLSGRTTRYFATSSNRQMAQPNPAGDPKTGQVHPRSPSPRTAAAKKPRTEEKKELSGKAAKRARAKQIRKGKYPAPEPCSAEDVLWRDVCEVLGQENVDRMLDEGKLESPYQFKEEVECIVKRVGSGGEAIAVSPGHPHWALVVPFSLPGERVRVRVYRNARLYSFADLIEVLDPNTNMMEVEGTAMRRDMSLVKCKYFGECAGCQFQMISYDDQLAFKRDVVVKAYKNFSNLPPSEIPTILPTHPSPLQYAYRTKITPHFEAPPKHARKSHPGTEGGFYEVKGEEKPDWLKIGFNKIGTGKVMDIEECVIATGVINEELRKVRGDVTRNIWKYKKGVSLLLRDSLEIPPDSDSVAINPLPAHTCITSHTATCRDQVGPFTFDYTAGSFFQNNNSVLVPLTNYVRDAIFGPPSSNAAPAGEKPTHLVDAYCGAGLFAITLSPDFETVAGIELSQDSIKSATRNAAINAGLVLASPSATIDTTTTATTTTTTPPPPPPPSKISFLAGDASHIFHTVSHFPRRLTTLVIDPPRKGCDEEFLRQLVEFGCGRVVYVSCNVHTQARDLGRIWELMAERAGEGKKKYVLESVRGFDLFPQTAHVESVAVLRLVEE